jgi:hypothetical protein
MEVTAQGKSELQPHIYQLADGLGMLRTLQEEDMIATVRYWATGTVLVDGKPCKLKSYDASINFHVPGMRVDYTCDGGQRRIEVVAGQAAWNETTPGVGATAAAGAAAERLLRIYTTPLGATKAAIAAGEMAVASAEGGAPVVTFPMPALNATMKATLNAAPYQVREGDEDWKKMQLPPGSVIERLETTIGGQVTETTYMDYGDWNGADYLSDVLFPRRIVQRRDGATLMDLTITKTNTYNPYVVMPVPPGIQ